MITKQQKATHKAIKLKAQIIRCSAAARKLIDKSRLGMEPTTATLDRLLGIKR